MNIEKLAKHLKEFTLDEIEMIAECDCKSELNKLINNNSIILENGVYKYKSEEVVQDFNLFVSKKKCTTNLTMPNAIRKFINDYVKPNCKAGTVKNYNSIFKIHIIPYFKNKKLKEITNDDVIAFYNNCLSRNLCARRLKNILALLNQLIRYYQSKGILKKKCSFQVKRLTNKNEFDESRIVCPNLT